VEIDISPTATPPRHLIKASLVSFSHISSAPHVSVLPLRPKYTRTPLHLALPIRLPNTAGMAALASPSFSGSAAQTMRRAGFWTTPRASASGGLSSSLSSFSPQTRWVSAGGGLRVREEERATKSPVGGGVGSGVGVLTIVHFVVVGPDGVHSYETGTDHVGFSFLAKPTRQFVPVRADFCTKLTDCYWPRVTLGRFVLHFIFLAHIRA